MFPCRRRSVLGKKPRRRLAHRLSTRPIRSKFFSSTLILASNSVSDAFSPTRHRGADERWREPQRRLWNPSRSCRIIVVRAAISPSLSAKSRRETYFRQELSAI